MAKKTFTDADALKNHIEKAMGELKKEIVVTSQARLGSTAVSPRDTGRFRSSWFAAEGSASSSVAPVGTDSANTDANGLKLTARSDIHLTNNLPYSEVLVAGDTVVSAPKTWFTDFLNGTTPKIVETAQQVIKKRYDV